MDMAYLVNQIKAPSVGLRLRQGEVIAVNVGPASIDVQIAGDTNTLPQVKYLDSYSPTATDIIWLLANGSDLLAIGKQAQ
jgi:hypothetical protein